MFHFFSTSCARKKVFNSLSITEFEPLPVVGAVLLGFNANVDRVAETPHNPPLHTYTNQQLCIPIPDKHR